MRWAAWVFCKLLHRTNIIAVAGYEIWYSIKLAWCEISKLGKIGSSKGFDDKPSTSWSIVLGKEPDAMSCQKNVDRRIV